MIATFGIHALSLVLPIQEVPPPPPPPPAVVFVGTTEGGTFDGGTVPDQTGFQSAGDAVPFDAGDGHVGWTGPAELTSEYGPETDDEYNARLARQYCEETPWMCEGS